MLYLSLKLSEFEKLHKKADSKRKTVTIEREVLAKLLIDHSAILGVLKDAGVDYKDSHDPVYDKPRPKLRIKKRK